MKLPSALRIPAVATAALILTACSTVQEYWPAKGADYKESRQEPTLELPPDLRSSEIEDSLVIPSATLSEYETDARTSAPSEAGVLPQPENIEVRQDGRQRWLVVQAPPEQVWPRVRDFWVQSGFLLTVEDPRVGILETEWAENRADIPQGPIRRTLGKVMDFAYSAATRDKFRVRLERGSEPGITEVYLTHQGVEEVVEGTADQDGNTVWKPRPSDPALEAEMLQRLMVHMGVEEERARTRLAQETQETPAARAELIRTNTGEVELRLGDDFSRAWRRTGLALDRVGFTVEDRNRSEGVYYVRYDDPLKQQEGEGLLSRLAFWSDDEQIDREAQYRIQLQASGAQTSVIVRDMDGKRDNSTTAARILTLLEEQLK
ncbi:outer membrane protein assembly factor BamC [Thiohalobacter thiocyanaticus]|uniref:Outer membrane protein assembly factor BamC n=1 Tax=Thiohalobacter thiocyanaticus TaxID=585455 RepID=A0A426QHB0_9GAMM|nr:outer membrane protein assembly factor BamC [Thiohalobacter thiocyanaticus]RRQ21141.1 outer membrane protein assembly factor BamC [Thiohalobacter thiocyanaticus]